MKRDKVNIFLGKISLFRCFSLCVIHSLRRLFFRLNHLRIVRKRFSHSTFRSQVTRCLRASAQASYRSNKSGVVCVLNTINSNKKIGIFSAEIFAIEVAYCIEILLIQLQVVSSNHFCSRIKHSYLRIYGILVCRELITACGRSE